MKPLLRDSMKGQGNIDVYQREEFSKIEQFPKNDKFHSAEKLQSQDKSRRLVVISEQMLIRTNETRNFRSRIKYWHVIQEALRKHVQP